MATDKETGEYKPEEATLFSIELKLDEFGTFYLDKSSPSKENLLKLSKVLNLPLPEITEMFYVLGIFYEETTDSFKKILNR